MNCGCGDGCNRVASDQSPSKLPRSSGRFLGLAAHHEACHGTARHSRSPRAAVGNQQRLDISFFQPTATYLGYELWVGVIAKVVAAKVFGRATYGEQVLQDTDQV